MGWKATGATGDGTQPGDVDYTVSTTRFTTHGYRDHEWRTEKFVMPNWAYALMKASKLSLIFNGVDIKADDPGGLTKAEWKANPQQAPRAEQYDTRKPSNKLRLGCAMSVA